MMRIYTDGSCYDNSKLKNKGSYGFAVYYKDKKQEFPDLTIVVKENDTTNNRMELKAILEAFKFLEHHNIKDDVTIYSDSQYAVYGYNDWSYKWVSNNFNENHVANRDIWEEMIVYKEILPNVQLTWIKGHSNCEENNYIDAQVNNAICL